MARRAAVPSTAAPSSRCWLQPRSSRANAAIRPPIGMKGLRQPAHRSKSSWDLLEKSAGARRMLDLPRLRLLVKDWPTGDWHGDDVEAPIRLALMRAIAAERVSAPGRRSGTPPMTPEFMLAAACAAWPPSDDRNEAIRCAAKGVTDWSLFQTHHRPPTNSRSGACQSRPGGRSDADRDRGRTCQRGACPGPSNLAMIGEALPPQIPLWSRNIPWPSSRAALAQLAYGNVASSATARISTF